MKRRFGVALFVVVLFVLASLLPAAAASPAGESKKRGHRSTSTNKAKIVSLIATPNPIADGGITSVSFVYMNLTDVAQMIGVRFGCTDRAGNQFLDGLESILQPHATATQTFGKSMADVVPGGFVTCQASITPLNGETSQNDRADNSSQIKVYRQGPKALP